MASGRKNYFRHSFFARNDDFILDLIDRFGFKGYFLWFALLEMCGEQAADEYPQIFRFHSSRLYRELKCNSRTLEPVLNHMQTRGKLELNRDEKFYEIRITNFPKYLGKYRSKCYPNTPNKRKEKESKEKESKVNKKIYKKVEKQASSTISVKEVVDLLNQKLGTSYRSASRKTISLLEARFKEGFNKLDDFALVIDQKKDQWQNDGKMAKYLRPETLFGPKFESYLQEAQLEQTDPLEGYFKKVYEKAGWELNEATNR